MMLPFCIINEELRIAQQAPATTFKNPKTPQKHTQNSRINLWQNVLWCFGTTCALTLFQQIKYLPTVIC
jgi:hypothetical protein